MKITKQHYDHMLECMRPIVADKRLPAYINQLKEDTRVKDINKRLRWDILYAGIKSSWVSDNLYTYANDDHIDTALRQIMKELGVSV